MKAYYFVFVLTLLVSIFYEAKTDKQWQWKLFWTFLPLFIYAAIRVDYGNDYSAYEGIYNEIHTQGFFQFDYDAHSELGFQFLNRILPSFRSLLVLSAFLLALSIGVFCYHNVPRNYLWLIIIMIFLNPEKNIFGILVPIRNGLVCSIFLLGFVWFQKRKLLRVFILTIALSYIHTSAIAFLPIAYLAAQNKTFTRKELIIWIGAIVALFAFSMSQLADLFTMLTENEFLDRYQNHFDVSEKHRGWLMIFASLLFIILYVFYLLKRSKFLDANTNSLMRMGMLYSVMMLMGSLSMRASYYYDMYLLASSTIIFADKKMPEWLRFGVVSLVLATSLYSMQVWMNSDWWHHSVYHSLLGDW